MVMLRGDFKAWNNMSQDERQKAVKKYSDWADELKSKDRLVSGAGLGETSKLIKKSSSGFTTTDGPYAETKEALVGYFAIKAQSLEEACEMVKAGCPAFEFDETAEVIEMFH
jgi:hypothetical protein